MTIPFLAPLAFLLGLLALPILVLYMLKMRRRQVEVSSVVLWQRLLRDREANAPWQRLRRNLLLILQLLLLAALVFALARPFLIVPAVARGAVIVLLDASASMSASDVAPSRFAMAQAQVRELANGLSADGLLTVILVGRQPEVLATATRDTAAVIAAVDAAQPQQGTVDWEAAFALAAGAARGGTPGETTIVILSDGGLPDGLAALPGEVRYVPIGSTEPIGRENVGIDAFSLRATASGPELFVRVTNFGTQPQRVLVTITSDDQLVVSELVEVEPARSASVTLDDLVDVPSNFQAQLTAAGEAGGAPDAFALDDTAWAVYQPPAAGRTLVLTPGNVFLEQMLASLPGVQAFRAAPDAPLPTDPFDLYVSDSLTETVAPAGAELLIINPISTTLFTVGEVFTNTQLTRVTADDPLTRYLDWGQVSVLQARRVAVPDWARVLVDSEGGPLVFAGETGGRRVAVLTFRLQDSDLPLQLAFPVLMSNLLAYLAPAQAFSAPDGLLPGETLLIRPAGGDDAIAIDDPTGQRFQAPATEAGVLFADTQLLGLYTVVSTQRVVGQFAVNLFDGGESTIAPATQLTLGQSPVTATPAEETGELELWPWLAAAALLILLIEWYVYHNGSVPPRRVSGATRS
ncbi:MAG TPA: VWA domain-containing protein [Anaerolineales bacterium]|nr:VWA domain-containing protein [Anaerolineales bacterium]